MKAMIWIAGGLLIVTSAMASAQVGQRMTPDEARQHVGEVVTVCGTVTVGRCERQTTLLDFGRSISGDRVSIAIPRAARAGLGTRLEARYQERGVCATGTVVRTGTDFQIEIRGPEALRIEREPANAEPVENAAFTTCDDGVVLPKVLREVRPQYTPEAMKDRIIGRVLVQGVVDVDGAVQHARVIEPLGASLDRAAVDAFSQWRFTPGTLNGQPVPVQIFVELTFTLK
jgi:TonB family protein